MAKKVRFSGIDVGGKLVPQDVSIEEAILGVLMIIPNSFEIIESILKKEVFYKDSHQKTFQAISDLHKEKGKIDILTVTDKLRKKGELELVGGSFFITQLTNRVASSAHLEYHSRILVEKYLSRELIRISGEFQVRAFDDEEDIFDVLDEFHRDIDEVRNYMTDDGNDVPLGVSIDERIEEKVKMVSEGITMTGITTGNPKLDNLISGFNKGCVYVFGAAPSMGKSVKSLNYAKIAAELGNRVYVFSLEMSKRDYIDRFLSEESKIPLSDFRANRLTEYDIEKMRAAGKAFKKLPISIDDNPSTNTNYIRKKLKAEIKRFGAVHLLIIDYAQLLKANEKASSREQEVSNTVKDIKVIAKEFNIPVILLAQIGRGIYQVSDRRPSLSYLRESGEIENSADFVGLIYRPSFYHDLEKHPDRNDMGSKIASIDQFEYDLLSELIVVKNRAGLPNVVLYEKFYGQFSCFRNDNLYNNTEIFIDESENSDIIPLPF